MSGATRSGRGHPTSVHLRVLPLWILLAAVVSVESAPASSGHTLHVKATGVQGTTGKVLFALHNVPDAFPGDPKQAVQLAMGDPAGGQATVAFSAIPPGRYAVAAFHDADGDGQLDTNWLGIPREGYGASRDAEGTMGPPSFADAAFEVAADRSIRFRLRYP